MLSTFTVTNTADNGDGSLRNAIVDANTAAGTDAIAFDIPGGNSRRSLQPRPCREITDPVVIDGYTQPGASPNTLAVGNDAVLKIVLDGSHVISGSGLRFLTGSSTLRGLVISEWAQDGISVLGNPGPRSRATSSVPTRRARSPSGNNGRTRVVQVVGALPRGLPNRAVIGEHRRARKRAM